MAVTESVELAMYSKPTTVLNKIAGYGDDLVGLGPNVQNYAQVFGYVKNASLIAQGQAAESQACHANWAQSKYNSDRHWGAAAKAIDSHLSSLRSTLGISFNTTKMQYAADQRLADVFGHTKNAWLRIQGKSTQSHGGHVNWALKSNRETVLAEVR